MDRDEIKQKKEFYQKNETFFDLSLTCKAGLVRVCADK